MTPSASRQRGGIAAWCLGATALVAVAALGGALGYWAFLNLSVGLRLSEQPLALGLPRELTVDAAVTNRLDIGLDGIIEARVPIDKPATIPMFGDYDLNVSIDAQVPVRFNVTYDGVLPISTQAHITARTTLDFRTIKQYRDIEIQAEIPLNLQVPVHFQVPVEETIRFRYEGPLTVAVNQHLKTRVDATFDTRLTVDQVVSTPVTRRFGLALQLPREPVRAIINHSDLGLPLETLRLEGTTDNDGPRRAGSPYGPAAR